MRFQTPLVPASLIRRYKRFLADVALPDGSEIVAHCPNPGSMMGLAEPGTKIWLERNDDPRKKLDYGWRLVEHANGHFTGIDTSVPNKMLKSALSARRVAAVAAYGSIRAEVPYADKSRVDFLLSTNDLPDLYLEVKSVTLSRVAGLAEFPDAKTARGARHMADLAAMVAQGHRAAVLFLVQRTDAQRVRIASDIDPAYADAFHRARAAGVEVICHRCAISPEAVTLDRELPVPPP